jgi:predicted O-methyltransferase YrrM
MGALWDAYLNRIVRRVRTAETSIGAEQILGTWASDLRFRLSAAERRAAARDLAGCARAEDCFRFAQAHLPGTVFFSPGSGASQTESEILPMLAFAAQRRPRTVVEIGTQAGGTTFLLGRLLPDVSLLVGVDLRVRNALRLRAFARAGLEQRFISGNSNEGGTRDLLVQALGGASIDLLFIDGDHSFRGAAHDFRAYRTLVAPGGLIAFHDIVPDSTLRSGQDSLAWVGEVPVLWDLLREQYRSHEFVDSWEQDGRGIGVLEHDPEIEPCLLPPRLAAVTRPPDGA